LPVDEEAIEKTKKKKINLNILSSEYSIQALVLLFHRFRSTNRHNFVLLF